MTRLDELMAEFGDYAPDAWTPLADWAPRRAHVYYLEILYPSGSLAPGWRPRTWLSAENAKFLSRRHRRELRQRQFRWPRERMFLSSSGAYRRAAHLTWLGATVRVHRSHMVLWPAVPDDGTQFDASGIPLDKELAT